MRYVFGYRAQSSIKALFIAHHSTCPYCKADDPQQSRITKRFECCRCNAEFIPKPPTEENICDFERFIMKKLIPPGTKVIVARTNKEHVIINSCGGSPDHSYVLDNGTMYWHHELKDPNANYVPKPGG